MNNNFDINKCKSNDFESYIVIDGREFLIEDVKEANAYFTKLYQFTIAYNGTTATTHWLTKETCDEIVVHKQKCSQKQNNEELVYLMPDDSETIYLGIVIDKLFVGFDKDTGVMFAKELTAQDRLVPKETFEKFYKKYIVYKEHIYFVDSFRNGVPASKSRFEVLTGKEIFPQTGTSYALTFVNNPQSDILMLTNDEVILLGLLSCL